MVNFALNLNDDLVATNNRYNLLKAKKNPGIFQTTVHDSKSVINDSNSGKNLERQSIIMTSQLDMNSISEIFTEKEYLKTATVDNHNNTIKEQNSEGAIIASEVSNKQPKVIENDQKEKPMASDSLLIPDIKETAKIITSDSIKFVETEDPFDSLFKLANSGSEQIQEGKKEKSNENLKKQSNDLLDLFN